MRTRPIAFAAAIILIAAACNSDANETTPSASTPSETTDSTSTGVNAELAVEAGAPFPAERCAANEDAGTITFLTGFDYAAASSIVDVIAADAAGYYDELCLDVEILPGFSAANYPQIASGTAQFASGGSFSEIVAFSAANDAEFVAVTVEGRSAIDALIIKSGEATELSDLEGSTIGVKGKLPPSIDVMLRGEGLVEGDNFNTVLLDGFDPIAHIAIEPIAGFPGWKSNEVGALERKGIGVHLFDPLDFGVPGSFGVIFTTTSFIDEHPTAAEDFVRATARGLADAVADPAAAAEAAVALITGNGNPNFLSPEGEVFRWETEAQLVLDGTPEGMGLGVPDPAALQNEVDAYTEVDLFGDSSTPSATDFIADGLAAGVYDASAAVIWPR
jgi:ABC-type nitrate/sulfonate/bicarbonate transport system substrate-binding protein